MNYTIADNQLTLDGALDLANRILSQSQADGAFVSLVEQRSALSRFSENQIAQNLNRDRFRFNVTSYFGRRSASTSTTELDETALIETLRRSEELARIAPEDPEWVPLLEPQTYDDRAPAYDEATANLSPLERGEIVRQVCQRSLRDRVNGSGTLSSSATLRAIASSTGLQGVECTTDAEFSFTAKIGNGSSWNQRSAISHAALPVEAIADKVIERAHLSQNPREISPGTYPVIFDGAAFADLLPWVIWNLDARAADEGRSFMSRTDDNGEVIGNGVGEALFSPLVRVQRHPAHPLLQSGTFFSDGLPATSLEIVRDGIPQSLSYSRYWAQQQGVAPTGAFYPIVMSGSDRELNDLIADTERGILVSRAWYVRYVNPRTLEVTGMTRDGTFWIEDGKIAYPIKNMRFNQSLPEMLKAVDALATVQRFDDSVIPGVRVSSFRFSSITDSI